MSNSTGSLVYFGPYEVTSEVFYRTSLCYAIVNIKPIMPGHVLVIPLRRVQYLSELNSDEVTEVFTAVQKVQKMLAKTYDTTDANVAIQDGPDAGQTVPHLHCHIIPRKRGNDTGDKIYELLQGEEGNVGGGLWDQTRPSPNVGKFPHVEDADRKPRSKEEMREEAAFFEKQMALELLPGSVLRAANRTVNLAFSFIDFLSSYSSWETYSEPVSSTSASRSVSSINMLLLQRIRSILHMVKNSIPKFDFMNNDKWLDMGTDGYQTEGFVGQYTCRNKSCRSKVLAYRSVEQTSSTTKDNLRFEQKIAGGSGRIVLSIPVTFEKEFVDMQKGLLSPKTPGTSCECEVVKEKFFATCKCVGCGKALNFYNQVRRGKEVGKLRWFLARKDDKVLQEKMLEEYVDWDEELAGEK
ncbi:hypothetical protein B2J93_7898 [Marssonina coronariae]|uniref:Bis(5'-adenosyl)-triphosphatase n=1 Tax=Diplocarpon coronariae TaxID=2795749 RepID=A0A218ZCR9_9HELO|nr:hypothetical protein B2J93_7898 [Marssonina coronariae]